MNKLENVKLNVSELNKLQDRFLKYTDNSEKTMQTYEIALRQFFNYLYEQGIDIPKREDIINYRNELKERLKPTTVNSYLIAVKSFFKWLEYEGLYKNIADNVKTIKSEKRHLKLGLEENQLNKVLENCSNLREELIIKLSITCGLRANELVNIKINDFYDDNGTIMLKVLGKGRDGIKSDLVKVDNRMFEFIKEYCEEYNVKDYLLTSTSNNNKGGKVNTITVRRIVNRIFEKSGLDKDLYTTHSLRHTSVVLALKSGLSIHEVSESVRHSQINTTMIYVNELNKKESKFASNLADMLF